MARSKPSSLTIRHKKSLLPDHTTGDNDNYDDFHSTVSPGSTSSGRLNVGLGSRLPACIVEGAWSVLIERFFSGSTFIAGGDDGPGGDAGETGDGVDVPASSTGMLVLRPRPGLATSAGTGGIGGRGAEGVDAVWLNIAFREASLLICRMRSISSAPPSEIAKC